MQSRRTNTLFTKESTRFIWAFAWRYGFWKFMVFVAAWVIVISFGFLAKQTGLEMFYSELAPSIIKVGLVGLVGLEGALYGSDLLFSLVALYAALWDCQHSGYGWYGRWKLSINPVGLENGSNTTTQKECSPPKQEVSGWFYS